MVTLIDEKNVRDVHSRKFITNGDKILKKYRKAAIKKAEYRKLKAIVPSVANQKTVSKLTVIEEAIKYIDQLHSALVRKVLTSDPNNNNNNNNDDDDDDTDCEANTVLHNLQRSCESKALPFSSADDFIRNFILQQQQQIFPQHSSLLQQRSNNIAAKNSTSSANKANSSFPQNAGRVAHPVMPMSQRNATLTTETVLSSTSSAMLPKVSTISRRPLANVTVSRSDFVVNKIGNNSNSHASAFRAKRILF